MMNCWPQGQELTPFGLGRPPRTTHDDELNSGRDWSKKLDCPPVHKCSMSLQYLHIFTAPHSQIKPIVPWHPKHITHEGRSSHPRLIQPETLSTYWYLVAMVRISFGVSRVLLLFESYICERRWRTMTSVNCAGYIPYQDLRMYHRKRRKGCLKRRVTYED